MAPKRVDQAVAVLVRPSAASLVIDMPRLFFLVLNVNNCFALNLARNALIGLAWTRWANPRYELVTPFGSGGKVII
jgi:hypothetical protein